MRSLTAMCEMYGGVICALASLCAVMEAASKHTANKQRRKVLRHLGGSTVLRVVKGSARVENFGRF